MNKRKFLLRNGITTAISILTFTMCFSIGFSSWYSVGGDTALNAGLIDADDLSHTYRPVFFNPSIQMFSFSKYGFLQSDDSYASTGGKIKATVHFNASSTSEVLPSLANNSACKLVVSLSSVDSTKTPTSIASEISITDEVLSCGNTGAASDFFTVKNSGSILASSDNKCLYKVFPLSGVNIACNDIVFIVNFTISYIGSDSFESFYNKYTSQNAGYILEYSLEEA